MSISSEITKLNTNLTDSYTAVSNKGGTIPTSQNFDNLATAIDSIPSGSSDSSGEFLVQVIDYDGTILKSERLDEGATFTLPSQPSHTGLIFQSWSSPVIITNNTVTVTNSDITIGATYTTASGLSEFDITLTTATGLSVTLNMDGTKNWGDGTSDTSTTHTYASAGDYTITCDGNIMTTSSDSGLFGQLDSDKNYYTRNARFGDSVMNISDYAFVYCYSFTNITIPSNATSIGNNAFQSCYSLANITIPSNATNIGNNAFQNCYSLANIIIPSSVTSIGNNVFQNCSPLTSVTIPSSVTSIGNNVFQNCYSLANITISSSVTSIGSQTFQGCSSLTSVTIPSSVTSIGNKAFQNCSSILEYDFSNYTAVPTLSSTNVFTNINKICKIKVPISLESQWKIATNWSTYADYIVGV